MQGCGSMSFGSNQDSTGLGLNGSYVDRYTFTCLEPGFIVIYSLLVYFFHKMHQ